jgi:4-amino-4-deoxy-L-arabinose transferase-like glycosyltransferase
MWQRIQTVFLILTSFISIVFLFVPLVIRRDAATFFVKNNLPAAAISIAIAAICIVAAACYKNRALQRRLAYLSIFFILIQAIIIYLLISETSFNLSLGLICPAAEIVCLLLAVRSVKKDEKLIRSMDRFR